MKHAKSPGPAEEPRPLPPARRGLFTVVMILAPFLFLGGLELTLRTAGYGSDPPLVIRKKERGKEVYAINRSVARRYFAQAGTVVPEPAEDSFEIVKRPNTVRIFCLGESSMAGFPYEFNATMPSFLRDRLQTLLPERNIEVINLGLAAVGSFVVDDFLQELLQYQPDLFIVYVGHNEFYGAYGVGSTIGTPGSPWMTRLALSLRHFCTYLLIRDIYASLFPSPAPAGGREDATLMAQVIREQEIPQGSPLYVRARAIYRDNLERIIDHAQGAGIPIVFSTLVSNLKDQVPFRSGFGDSTTPAMQSRILAMDAAGERFLAGGRADSALAILTEGSRLDSTYALTLYLRGRTELATGASGAARVSFARAKDKDLLRFRMSEEFQSDLQDICARKGVPVARSDSAFAAGSPDGIQGRELILEHLHPNIGGYFLMAKAVCRTVVSSGVLGPSVRPDLDRDKTDAEYLALSTVSEFDTLVGKIRTELLTHQWPFPVPERPYTYLPRTPVEMIVYDYVMKRTTWSAARYRLAEYYEGKGEYDRAQREFLAVARIIPFSHIPLTRAAGYSMLRGRRAEAKLLYRKSIGVEDNPYARMQIGYLLLEEDSAAAGARELEAGLALDERLGHKLDPNAVGLGRYMLAVAYAKTGRYDEAVREVEKALAINPASQDFRGLRRQLDALRKPSHR
jgi:tetratricopeptide (TPR) repeat protein